MKNICIVLWKPYWKIYILVSFLFFVSCIKKPPVDEKQQVKLNVEEFLNDENYEKWISKEYHKSNLITVLVYYGNEINFSSYREIMVSDNLIADKDLVRNFIIKSMDEEWMRRHIYLSSDSIKYIW